MQFILSLKAESIGGGNYRMVAMLDGMVALSNPNDVAIEWPAGLLFPVQLQNVPYDLKWNIRKSDGSRITTTASSADFGLFVGRISGGTTGRSEGFTLEPGEAVVFGSTTGNGPQLDLRRGFVPSGGVRINPSGNGWDLRATNLKANDLIDFTLTKGDTGYRGTYTYYNAWIGDRRTGGNAKGWQIDSCSLSAQGNINSDQMNELMISPIRPPQVRPVRDFLRPQPFMMISFLRNVERDSGGSPRDAFASRPFQLAESARGWSGYSPNTVATSLHANQRMIIAEPLNYQFRTMAAGNGGQHVYHGGGRQPNLGGSFTVIRRRLPLAPPLSLGAFENAIAAGFSERFKDAPAIAPDPYPSDAMALSGDRAATPSIAKAIGNSWASPFLKPDQVFRPSSGGGAPDQRATTDPSWMANTALWDSWFLSGIVNDTRAGGSPYITDRRTPRRQFQDLAEGTGALRNTRFIFHAHQPAEEAVDELFDGETFKPQSIGKLANYLLVDGAFNVNSTSVDAWTALLSSVREQEIIKAGGATQSFDHPFGTLGYAVNTATSGTAGDWTGLRDLGKSDIEKLAEAIVEEVKSRGPFLSMADFVNRRPNGESSQQALGALQAAIDQTGLNQDHSAAERTVAAADLDPLPGSGTVASELVPARAIGTPGYLSQAGVLTAIGSQITVRSDTFRIRAYGDARDASGRILSRAWCEAVIQRLPEFVDPVNSPEVDSNTLSSVNQRFGRRLTMRGFRWLTAEEV